VFLRRYLLNFVLRLCFSTVFVYVSSTYVASFCCLGLCGYTSEFSSPFVCGNCQRHWPEARANSSTGDSSAAIRTSKRIYSVYKDHPGSILHFVVCNHMTEEIISFRMLATSCTTSERGSPIHLQMIGLEKAN